MANVVEGLYYTDSHEYIKVEGEYGFIGITDYAQSQLGQVAARAFGWKNSIPIPAN